MHRTITVAMAAAITARAFGLQADDGKRQRSRKRDQRECDSRGGRRMNGTWKVDLATVKIDQKPDQLLLKDGQSPVRPRRADRACSGRCVPPGHPTLCGQHVSQGRRRSQRHRTAKKGTAVTGSASIAFRATAIR